MRETQFWDIVNECRYASQGSFARRVELLHEALLRLSVDEVRSFQALFDGFVARADIQSLMDAAHLVGGGCSDDGFMDFRRWLISAGEEVYSSAVADADTLADIEFGDGGEPDCFFEEYGYVARRAYSELSGHEMIATGPSLDAAMERRRRMERSEGPPSPLPRLRGKYASW